MAKTRLASSTKLANYLGAGKDFDPSEVPTLRDVLRKGILLQETNKKNFPVNVMLKDGNEYTVKRRELLHR